MLIAVMRTNPNSPYSLATDNRWPVAKPGFARGDYRNWEYFRDAAERMKSSRHSSTHFLRSGWKSVKQQIRAMGYRISGIGDAGDQNELNTLDQLQFGSVERGGQGSPSQFITISNTVGISSKLPNLDRERNAALLAYGTPALQRACDEQAQEMRDWNLNKDLEAELVAEWNSVPDAAPYKKGTHVNKLRIIESMSESPGELDAF